MATNSRRVSVLLLILAPLIALGRALISGEAIGPFDQIRQMAPWFGPKPAQPWDVLQADGVLQFYSWRDLVFEAWSHGQLPAWNHFQLAGTPLLANSQSGALYPPHILAGLLHLPTGLAITLLAWFHLSVAGVGTSALARRFGANETGATVSGFLFAMSPFMLGWTALSSVITTVCWIPWLLFGLMTIAERPSSRRGVIVTATATALMVLAGHLQFAAYGGIAGLLFIAALIIPRRSDVGRLRLAALMLAGLVLGGGLAAPQLLPVLAYSKFSHRQNVASEDGYRAYSAAALSPTDLASRIANPLGQGDPTSPAAEGASVSTFWPAISRPGANFAESAVTIGPLAILLIAAGIAGRARWRRLSPALLVAAVAALLATGTALGRVLYFGVPGWSATGSPGRIAVLFVLMLSVVAGSLVSQRPLEPRRALLGLVAGVLVILATTVPMIDPAPAGIAPDTWAALTAGVASSAPMFVIGVLAAAGLTFVALTREGIIARLAMAAAALLVVLPSASHLVRSGDPSFLRQPPAGIDASERIAFVNDQWGLTGAAPAIMPPNTASAARVHDVAGYDSLLHRDSKAVLDGIDGTDSAPPANGNMAFVKPTADPAKLAEAGVTQVWSRQELPEAFGPAETREGFFVYRLTGPGRASLAGGTPLISEEAFGRLKVTVDRVGELTLRERAMPGWTATMDGNPLPIRGGKWLVVDVPKAGTVGFRYVPPGMSLGWLVAAGSLVFLGVAAWRKIGMVQDASGSTNRTVEPSGDV